MHLLCQYIITNKTFKGKTNRWVVMPWDVLSVGAFAADWWFCAYLNLVMYWICQYLIVKKHQYKEKTMKNRSAVLPWDVLGVGASAADWWFVFI